MSAAIAKVKAWREDPVRFVREVFQVEPDAWQADVLRAFPTHNRLAMKASKGPGKSTVEAWCAWNFLMTRPHPKIVAVSITGDNLRDGLWSEMSKWQQKSPLLLAAFEWNAERITARENPETWFMAARTWAKGADASQQANTLAGIHADYVLFILDECGGIPDSVMSAAEGGLSTGIECKLLIGGNPTHLEGPLYRALTKERALWHVTEVSGDPDDPKRSPRIGIEWARDQIAKYGRDHPYVLVNVLGQFPPSQSNSLISLAVVLDAQKRQITDAEYKSEPKVIGVDVARSDNGDRSVIQVRQGRVAFRPQVLRTRDLMVLVDNIAKQVKDTNADALFVDSTGVGAGVADRLNQLGFHCVGVNFSEAAANPMAHLNKRVEMWDNMRAWLPTACAYDSPELAAELTAPTYWYDGQNKLRLESKEDIVGRGLPSPDLGDALALTFAHPVNNIPLTHQHRQRTVERKYDVFAKR